MIFSMILTLTPNARGDLPEGQLMDVAMEAGLGRSLCIIGCHGLGADYTSAAQIFDDLMAGIDVRIRERKVPVAEPLILLVHWTSAITENDGSLLNCLTPAAFWAKEKFADIVGARGVWSAIDMVLRHSPVPVRFVGVGHSFGCKVICAAFRQVVRAGIPSNAVAFHAHLLAPAMPDNALEPLGIYSELLKLP